mmetsp:Transcript_13555/g.21149  ORF Transcript_13555/g.21149 Transcript_13555/m.21149 type:complete len:105 (-) Transcript_13555:63-377(-)
MFMHSEDVSTEFKKCHLEKPVVDLANFCLAHLDDKCGPIPILKHWGRWFTKLNFIAGDIFVVLISTGWTFPAADEEEFKSQMRIIGARLGEAIRLIVDFAPPQL